MVYLALGCQWTLMLVFAVSAGSKLRSRAALRNFVAATGRLVPVARRRAGPLATAVIAAESVTAGLTVLPATGAFGLLAAAGLVSAFTVAIAAALRRGSTTGCACFGRSATPLGARHLVRNAALLAVAGTGLLARGFGPPAAPAAAGSAVAAVAAVLVALLVVAYDDLADLFLATSQTPQGEPRAVHRRPRRPGHVARAAEPHPHPRRDPTAAQP